MSPAEAGAACCCQCEGKRIAITADGAGSARAGAAWAALTAVIAIVVVLDGAVSGRVMRTGVTTDARATAGLWTAGLWSAATAVELAPGERAALV